MRSRGSPSRSRTMLTGKGTAKSLMKSTSPLSLNLLINSAARVLILVSCLAISRGEKPGSRARRKAVCSGGSSSVGITSQLSPIMGANMELPFFMKSTLFSYTAFRSSARVSTQQPRGGTGKTLVPKKIGGPLWSSGTRCLWGWM